jgi:hypothetical protein
MKLFTTISAFFAVATAWAQPVLGPSFAPFVGSTYTYRYADAVDYASLNITEGANQTWFFDLNKGFDSATTSLIAPSASPFAADFPDATICAKTPGIFPDFRFYKPTDNGVLYYGGVTDLGTSQAKTLNDDPYGYSLPYDLTFGSRKTDTVYYNSIVSGSNPTNKQGYYIDTTEYVGYGTLYLNNEEFLNAVMIGVRSFTYDINGVQQSKAASVSWFVPNYPAPILTIDILFFSGVKRAYPNYINPRTAITSTAPRVAAGVWAYPNPSTDKVYLHGLPPAEATLSVFSATGAKTVLPVNQGTISLTSLTPGVYYAHIQGRPLRFVKQ